LSNPYFYIQAEVSRLTSRATELDALVSVLRGQLDQAGSHEMQAVRDVQRQLDSAEAEVVRLRDRLADREVKEEALNARIKSHEKELIRLQEAVFKRDRQLREEQEKGESVQSQIDAIRKGYESEVEEAKAALTKQKQANSDMVLQQRREVERLEQEIAERVPEMVASAVAQVEARSAAKHAKELADQRLMSDLQREKLKQENSDLQTIYAEKEARQRLQMADEKVELEKLRLGQKAAQRRCEDLEEQVQELRRQLRLTAHTAQYSGAQSARRGGGLNRSMNLSQGAPPKTSLDFSRMLDQGFEGVRGSREGAVSQSFDAHYAQQEQNDENYYDGNEENAGEDALMSQTVSFINDQLAFMKRQINSSLQPRETPVTGSFTRTVPSASRTPAVVHSSAQNTAPGSVAPSSKKPFEHAQLSRICILVFDSLSPFPRFPAQAF
jgi:DNA repair exonuclease SbcCD ATPase subunit